MFEYDYTFCTDKSCRWKSCLRHPSKIPVGVPVSVSDLGSHRNETGICDYYVGEEVRDGNTRETD